MYLSKHQSEKQSPSDELRNFFAVLCHCVVCERRIAGTQQGATQVTNGLPKFKPSQPLKTSQNYRIDGFDADAVELTTHSPIFHGVSSSLGPFKLN